jgi:hypothetical protein
MIVFSLLIVQLYSDRPPDILSRKEIALLLSLLMNKKSSARRSNAYIFKVSSIHKDV